MEQIPKSLNLVLLGRTGAGKSSSGNTILGQEAFISKKSSKPVTQDVAVESGTVGQFKINVYDTPGLYDTDINEEEIQQTLEEVFQKCESDLCVFLMVIKAEKFPEKEKEMAEKIEKLLGEKRLKKTWILLTKGDELEEENMTIKEFLDDTEPLKKLVQKYEQRYHVFNNKAKGATLAEQVRTLLIKILEPYFAPLDEDVAETLKQDPLRRKIAKDIEPDTDNLPSRRIVLLGKSGVGKSATGNTILGQKEFISAMKMVSVTSECSKERVSVSGRSVSVVDTPGFFDTQMEDEELAKEIAKSVYESSPGPHAFLIVLRVNDRFTKHEQQIPQLIEIMFGKEVLKYSIILFTNGDQLEDETIEGLVDKNSKLRHLVDQCGGRYHVFNNKDQKNREQVNDLLQKIDTMIEQNGGGHYSNQMFEDAQRIRQEEEERIKREAEKRKQDEKKRVEQEIEKAVRAEYEGGKKQADTGSGFNNFFSKHERFFYLAAVAIGIACGGAVGGVVAKAVVSGAVAKTAVVGVGAVGGVVAKTVVSGAVAKTAVGVGAVVGGAVGGAVGHWLT